jgi:hypothetical protein
VGCSTRKPCPRETAVETLRAPRQGLARRAGKRRRASDARVDCEAEACGRAGRSANPAPCSRNPAGERRERTRDVARRETRRLRSGGDRSTRATPREVPRRDERRHDAGGVERHRGVRERAPRTPRHRQRACARGGWRFRPPEHHLQPA